MTPRFQLVGTFAKLNALFGRGLVVSVGAIVLAAFLAGMAMLALMSSVAPTTLTIASGPDGSVFRKTADKYRAILAREGVTLKILPSQGSVDNFRKLSDPRVAVDVGFVMGGEVKENDAANLVSLGSISYQPLMIFYRGKVRTLLSEFKGGRLDVGREGSGAYALAAALLKANGFAPGDGTVLLNGSADDPLRELRDGQADAVFLMGESTPTAMMRELLHTPDIHLYNFTQADGYVRRIGYLNKLELPKGSLDLGQNIPGEDLNLVGPTVELVARSNLHPALSDLLLEAAREIHGKPGLFKKRGEFPSPIEHEFRISPDAIRYYASGKSFLYRTFPFWIASMIARTLAVVVPVALFLIPALKITPALYRWGIESRIYRWYRALLELERDASEPHFDLRRLEELLQRLDHIEDMVNRIVIPASRGNLFYELRGHIGFVREKLLAKQAVFANAQNPSAGEEDG